VVVCLTVTAHNGSMVVHSLPQLSGSPVLRGHAGRSVNTDSDTMSSTVPSLTTSRPARPDMDQLQLQLQQRLCQQRVRNERNLVDWRPASECGTNVDTQNVPTPTPFSRYSAPPTGGVLVKVGPAIRPADKMTMMCISSQHATTLASSSPSSSAAVKPGESPPTAGRPLPHSQSSGSTRSAVGSNFTPPGSSSAAVGRSSPTVTSQHVRSDAAKVLSCY